MLEANIYDNFNPNYLGVSDYELPNGNMTTRPLPNPKARCVIMDFELWETGYLYTSSGVFSSPVEVGDVVEILFPETYPAETQKGTVKSLNLAYVYVVTDVDDGNRATIKNYFWAMIEGLDIPNTIVKTTNFAIIDYLIDRQKANLMIHGYAFNSDVFAGKATLNRKAETAEATDVAKRVFNKVAMQPTVIIYQNTKAPDGTIIDPRNTIVINLASRSWDRNYITTRIDDKQNVVTDTETIIERSTYNFAVVFTKNATTEDYTDPPKLYTVLEDGSVINYENYTGDGTDLPEQRIVKTLFYDEPPADSTIKAEISPSTIVQRIIFDQNELMPMYVNDLVHLWYNNTLYTGVIVDRMKTETQDRLVFVEVAP